MIDKIISLKNHLGFMKYFKNTSWLFFEKILRMFVGLFVGIWVARYLGPERFGLFSYAQSFVGLFVAIATLGLDGIVVRELVKDESRTNELIGTAFYLKLIGAILTLLVLVIATQFTSNDRYTNLLVFIIASATIFQSFNVVDMYFQSKVLSKYVVFSNIISLFIGSIIKITLILINAPLVAFAWAILFDSIVLALGFIYFFLKYSTLEIKKIKFSKVVAIILLKDSWPMAITILVIMSYSNLNQILIANFLGNEQLGYYSVAYRICTLVDFIPIIIVGSLFPTIVNLKKYSLSYINRLQSLSNLLVLLAFLYSIFICFFAKEIIIMLYGDGYYIAIEILQILSFSCVFSFIGYLSGRIFIIYNLGKIYLFRAILGLVVLYCFSIILLPHYGLKGGAISLLVAEFFVVFVSDIFFLKETKDILIIKIKSLYSFFSIRFI